MYDYAIIGGGIVGLSTGMAITKRFPHAKIAVIEKEKDLARHQTGHNSGVIHSGIYYKPGSLKARLARDGNAAMVSFCEEYHVPYEMCGKVIVATEAEELPLLERLYERGLQNGLDITRIGLEELKEIEPHVKGLGGIRVPSCGIVDYQAVSKAFASVIQQGQADICLETKVDHIVDNHDAVVLETSRGTIKSRFLINCAGLHSDRVTKMAQMPTDIRIVPFRGEYYELVPEKRHLVKHLIYPVPDPDFPFLGVHFTRMIDGSVHAGPNAVLSFKREGYKKTDFDLKDVAEVLSYPGFWKLAIPHMSSGLKEMVRSFSKKSFLTSLQRLIPELTEKDIRPAEAGVRAQALKSNGEMVDDFAFYSGKNSLHVGNAPSPAATASILIGEEIVKNIPMPEQHLTVSVHQKGKCGKCAVCSLDPLEQTSV